mgnify:CR=1 FL=1
MKPGLRTSDNYYDQQNYHEEMDFSQEVDDWAQFLGSIGGGGKPFSELATTIEYNFHQKSGNENRYLTFTNQENFFVKQKREDAKRIWYDWKNIRALKLKQSPLTCNVATLQ